MGMLDSELLFLNAAAYNAAPAVVDMGNAVQPGSGEQIKGFVQCAGGDMAGTTALVVKHGDTAATATTTIDTIAMTAAQANAGFNFNLQITGLKRFVTIEFTAISAGTLITAGLALNVQTA